MSCVEEKRNNVSILPEKKLPEWFRQDLPDVNKIKKLKDLFRGSDLNTVCEGAHCPNMGKCWGFGVATFMILGDTCTRSCRFCSVHSGVPAKIDRDEPIKVRDAVEKMGLRYVVITSVTRDDLDDKGAGQFAATIKGLKSSRCEIKVEVLIPDLLNDTDLINIVVDAGPDVIAHNIETVRRLYPSVRYQADYDMSLDVLRNIKRRDKGMITKSSIMVGLGETRKEVESAMEDVLSSGCEIITIGQYLSPGIGNRNVDVERFVTPDEFAEYKKYGESIGFKYVLSEPLARSSFIAEVGYNIASIKCQMRVKQINLVDKFPI